MFRPHFLLFSLLVLGAMCALPPLAVAEEPAAAPADVIATDAEAAAALDTFKTEYKARGLKGEDKLSQRDWAMSELARRQHPDIVAALGKISKGSDKTLRILAVIYLGEQTELPGLAGPWIQKALKKRAKEPVLVLSALQSLGNLRYLGATKELAAYLEHRDFAVKKASIQAIGQIGEMRLWKQVLKLAGVEVKTGDDVTASTDSGGKEEVVEEGYSYDGVEVTYDTGTSGDGDQKMAEKLGKAQLAKNKAAAKGKGGGGGSGGASAGSGATGKGGVARDPKELLPFVLRTLWLLTGERFATSKDVAEWVRENRGLIKERIELLNEMEKAQKEEAKELR